MVSGQREIVISDTVLFLVAAIKKVDRSCKNIFLQYVNQNKIHSLLLGGNMKGLLTVNQVVRCVNICLLLHLEEVGIHLWLEQRERNEGNQKDNPPPIPLVRVSDIVHDRKSN